MVFSELSIEELNLWTITWRAGYVLFFFALLIIHTFLGQLEDDRG